MNEEQKPHKTWTMLKKAVILTPFTKSIIPNFTSNAPVKDKYGEWKLTWEYDKPETQGEILYGEMYKDYSENIYKLFDGIGAGDTSTANIQLTTDQHYPGQLTIILELPKNIYIKPETMRLSYSQQGSCRFYTVSGCKKNGEWDTLIKRTDMWDKYSILQTIPNADYYSKIKLYFERTYSNQSTHCIHANEFQILSGTLRIGG